MSSSLKVLRRSDYSPVPWTATHTDLDFNIRPNSTRVSATSLFIRNVTQQPVDGPVVLNRGNDVTLVSILLDNSPIEYSLDDKILSFTVPPGATKDGKFSLTVVTDIVPEKNTHLEGLYYSSSAYTTQCEAEGFRSITFFTDRPDVMAKWRVRVEADEVSCPVLLSNGNVVASGKAGEGRHFAVYEDPWAKPSYLFALVAGDLTKTEDSFTTFSGKKVDLRIYTEARDADKVGWAMESLKRAMRWDETKFGLEYDLNLFNIVATSSFNMGAMENKSLNIFNSRLILASPKTASDLDFNRIEGVIAHEYFHNWTGNRVTCRDWFQLTLKEGLTVYRDQTFTAETNSKPIKRLEDVASLRIRQFSEDAGPTAHSIRPDEVGKMDNFYSATVYEKGAEIIRLYEQVFGVSGFRKGMDLYFKRHDGSAVTCDDFWQAMHDANQDQPIGQKALQSLKKWYSQAGTPELTVTPSYNAENKSLTLACKQTTPASPGQPTKVPVLIPIAVGLVGTDGKDLPLTLNGVTEPSTTAMLLFTEAEQSFVFTNVPSGAVPSILRNFSAPVRLTVVGQSDHDLTHLLAHDSDSFNRFEAGQVLARNTLLALYDAALAAGGSTNGLSVPSSLIGALKNVLTDTSLDGSFIARSISLPQEIELVDAIANRKGGLGADPVLVRSVRDLSVNAIATALQAELEAAISSADAAIAEAEVISGGYSPDFKSVARRALKNKAIAYLSTLKKPTITTSILARFKAAKNMTDQIASLAALIDLPGAERDEALSSFAEEFKDEPLVLLKWFSLQAMASGTRTTEIVKKLKAHPSFVITTPNFCYSLFGAFSSSTESFHNIDGSGYKFLAEVVVELDAINPQVASRIVSAFAKLGQYDSARRALIRKELENIAAHKISENVGEIVSRSLAASV